MPYFIKGFRYIKKYPSHIFGGRYGGGGGYNQEMHKYYEQWKVIDTHMNQKVENVIGYHKEENSLEGIQKWN